MLGLKAIRRKGRKVRKPLIEARMRKYETRPGRRTEKRASPTHHPRPRQEEVRHRRREIEHPFPTYTLATTHDFAYALEQPEVLVDCHERNAEQRPRFLDFEMAFEDGEEIGGGVRVDGNGRSDGVDLEEVEEGVGGV